MPRPGNRPMPCARTRMRILRTGRASSRTRPGSLTPHGQAASPPVLSSQGRVSAQPCLPSCRRPFRTFCRQQGVTPFMVLYATFAALLHRYSGQPEVCVGTPMAGRTHPATEDVVGLFVNTVLRTHAQPEDSFAALLAQVRTTVLESIAHQDAPFERVVQALGVQRSPRHSPLFQVMFGLIRAGHSLAQALPGLQGHPLWPAALATSQFDLSVVLTESPDGLSLAASYSTDLFEAGNRRVHAAPLRAPARTCTPVAILAAGCPAHGTRR